MLPTPQPGLPPLVPLRLGAAALAFAAFGLPAAAQAQAAEKPAETQAPAQSEPQAQPVTGTLDPERQIAFEADGASYDSETEVVTVFGNVVMRRDGQSVRADQVTWDRKTGQIVATGNIRFVDADGNQLFTDRIELTDEFKAGAMENMLLALREGGRLAASKGERNADGNILLHNAAYSACAVEDSRGCPHKPSWRVTAKRVIYDPDKRSVRFFGARLELFGARLLPLPGLLLTTDGRPISGLLIPDVRLSASNGVELSETWYQRLSDNKDLALTGYIYTGALPMVQAQYRSLDSHGAYQITGYVTRSSRIPLGTTTASSQQDFRGHLYTHGRLQFDPTWSLTFAARVASDRTFLPR